MDFSKLQLPPEGEARGEQEAAQEEKPEATVAPGSAPASGSAAPRRNPFQSFGQVTLPDGGGSADELDDESAKEAHTLPPVESIPASVPTPATDGAVGSSSERRDELPARDAVAVVEEQASTEVASADDEVPVLNFRRATSVDAPVEFGERLRKRRELRDEPPSALGEKPAPAVAPAVEPAEDEYPADGYEDESAASPFEDTYDEPYFDAVEEPGEGDFLDASDGDYFDEPFEGVTGAESTPVAQADEPRRRRVGWALPAEEERSSNPFLDEGDEFTLRVDEMAKGRYNREEFDDEAPAEVFTGFVKTEASGPLTGLVGEASTAREGEVTVAASGREVGGGKSAASPAAAPEVFDELLSALLDDEEEAPALLSPPVRAPEEAFAAVREGTKSGDPLLPKDREAMERFAQVGREKREEKRLAEASRREELAEEAPTGKAPLESSMTSTPVEEVLVDREGKGSKGGRSAFTGPKEAAKEKERYRYMRPNGKLNGAELAVIKRMGTSSSRLRDDRTAAEQLRAPVGRNETEPERQERIRKVTRVLGGKDAMKRDAKARFGLKDRELLSFLAMFRYATDVQLARMWSESYYTTYNRLKKLRSQGLVIDKKLYGARPIWFLTEAGLLLSGYDLPRVTESKLTFSMFPHQFTVNNTAANLWGANVNVLNLPDYPARHRVNDRGEATRGEELASELEIQSSFGRMKLFQSSDVYRPQLLASIEREFKEWEAAGGPAFGPSPEMLYGNEYMWSLMPEYLLKLAYHVPDLVVKRPRAADGSPESLAVEIEISNKPSASYEKVLRAYSADKTLYKKVIWVCKNVAPARKLEEIAKRIGLWQEGRIDIVPIFTEDGVFKGRDLWTI